jgi:lipopolysaccharide/colanic/teichoic acid biosynthesis glycosyltransferase
MGRLEGRAILSPVADRLLTHWSGVAKRATDLLLCLAALAVCALPMAAIALLIRLGSLGRSCWCQCAKSAR